MIASRIPIAPEDVASHYDELDAFYRDIWGDHVHHGLWLHGNESREEATRLMVEMLAAEARIGEGTRVCDIGCGYGATARVLARRWGARVTAITISPAQHEFAQNQPSDGGPSPEYILADWLQCAVPDEAFDAAIACESSEHMPDKARFFTQAAKALRAGGRLVVCAWLSAEAPRRWQNEWLLEPICRESRMPHLGTETDYRKLAEEAGFLCESVQDVSLQVARTWPSIAWTFFVKLLRNPRYARFLCHQHAHNRVFALTAFRLWFAFRTGPLRYGVFTFVKPAA